MLGSPLAPGLLSIRKQLILAVPRTYKLSFSSGMSHFKDKKYRSRKKTPIMLVLKSSLYG